MDRAFALSGAAYLAQPTGRKAADLEEFAERLREADTATLFYHTQIPRLEDPDDGDVPADEFSNWIRGVLQDPETAERLAFAVQASSAETEDLRHALFAVLDAVSTRRRKRGTATEGGAFVFLRTDVVPVAMEQSAQSPEELMEMLAHADRSVWFHHVIEEAWLHPGPTPIVEWLIERHEDALADWLARAASRGLSVEDLRAELLRHWGRSSARRRLVASDRAPADARDVMRAFARRLAKERRR